MGVPRLFRGTSRAWGFGRLMTHSDAQESRFALGSLRTTASHTIGVPHLVELFGWCRRTRPMSATARRSSTTTCSGRPTQAGRQRSFRHLRELYFLDPVAT